MIIELKGNVLKLLSSTSPRLLTEYVKSQARDMTEAERNGLFLFPVVSNLKNGLSNQTI